MYSTRGGGSSAASRSAIDEAVVGAEGVDEPAVLAPDVDDQRLAGRAGRGRSARPGQSTPLAASVSAANRPKTSSPTRPQIAARTPSRARSTAALAAPPPMFSTRSSAITSSPAAGRWSIGGAEVVGHDQPGADDGDSPRRRTTGVDTALAIAGSRIGAGGRLATTAAGRSAASNDRAAESAARRCRPGIESSGVRQTRVVDRGDDLVAGGVGGAVPGRLPISSSISATVSTSRSIRASVSRSRSSRCSSRRR